jgi:hypothetical protein
VTIEATRKPATNALGLFILRPCYFFILHRRSI